MRQQLNNRKTCSTLPQTLLCVNNRWVFTHRTAIWEDGQHFFVSYSHSVRNENLFTFTFTQILYFVPQASVFVSARQEEKNKRGEVQPSKDMVLSYTLTICTLLRERVLFWLWRCPWGGSHMCAMLLELRLRLDEDLRVESTDYGHDRKKRAYRAWLL